MNNFGELENHSSALEYLADCLKEGTLVLFLGAGSSKGFGLPDWIGLINGLREDVGLPALVAPQSADSLQQAASEVLDKAGSQRKLIKLISPRLYDEFVKKSFTSAFDNHLLVAISALLMGSKRGHVTRVVTLNYDGVLEWFLSLFGFVVKTIHTLPMLEGDEDVRVYHPHGFVPIPGSKHRIGSEEIILDLLSANKRLGTIGHPWFLMTKNILETGICLFIGMSGDTLSDRMVAPLLSNCGPNCSNSRPLGIWIVLGEISPSKKKEFDSNNIIPLTFQTPGQIP